MMYQERLAIAVKVNGKVLRESGENNDTVFIPFGSEYSIYVKNMNSVRALVRFEIDGTDATGGTSIIVPANDSIEIERFIKNGNMREGLKFKFIERTAKIENGPRGIKVEDGLIRVQFEFEREPAKIVPTPWPVYSTRDSYYHSLLSDPMARSVGATAADLMNVQYSTTCSADASASLSNNAVSASMASYEAPRSALRSAGSRKMSFSSAEAPKTKGISAEVNDKGITVGGSKSEQSFTYGSWFPTDGVKHVMVLRVFGETAKGEKIEKPVLVKTKQECPTCGTMNRHGTKFCRECGTGLEQL